MVDHHAQSTARQYQDSPHTRLKLMQVSRINALMARSYTDDIDIRSGALSAPCDRSRPGQRDDIGCGFEPLLLPI